MLRTGLATAVASLMVAGCLQGTPAHDGTGGAQKDGGAGAVSNPALFPVTVVNSRVGYIDPTGTLVIPGEFDFGGPFHEGLAAVRKHGKFCYIDGTGKVVIDCRFDETNRFSEGFAWARIGSEHLIIDRAGQVRIQGHSFAHVSHISMGPAFKEGLSIVQRAGPAPSGAVVYGAIDRSGKQVIPAIHSSLHHFSEGLAFAHGPMGQGFVDRRGNLVIDFGAAGLRRISDHFSEGMAAFAIPDSKGADVCGFIDTTGKVVIQATFERAHPFHEGLAYVNSKGKGGYVDKSGAFVIAPTRSYWQEEGLPEEPHPERFSEGLAVAHEVTDEGGRVGFIDRTGRWVIEPRFRFAYPFANGLAKVIVIQGPDNYQHTGYIDKTGAYVWQPTR